MEVFIFISYQDKILMNKNGINSRRLINKFRKVNMMNQMKKK